MRFRLPEWDVAMTDALVSYWTAWNETDLNAVPGHLVSAVTDDVEWNDPRDSFVGRAALAEAIRSLRISRPEYRFTVASEIDHHHGRFRYRWDMVSRGRVLMEGVDIVTAEPETGLIRRVDGFFGEPTPVRELDSGVPAIFRSPNGAT